MMGSAPSFVGGQLGRYELRGAIARGGMATVYIGRMSGAAGFARTVAIKRLHPHLASDRVFAAMFVDEARLAARIQHPNVVDTLDVVSDGEELLIVMEFVHGETLAKLVRAAANQSMVLPAPVVSSIVIGALEGLHAAHEATNEHGQPLGIVHRDVSPQNILVATDGVPRVLDFGVAKAAGRVQETEGSEIKGKLAYMSPEQLTRKTVDRRSDIFAMGVVLWEALTSKRLFAGEDAASTLYSILNDQIKPPSAIVGGLPPAIDEVVLKALARDPTRRYATAQEMALALETACMPAPARHAGKWVMELAGEAVKKRAEQVRAVEGSSTAMPVADDLSQSSGAQPISARRIPAAAAAAPESWRHVTGSHVSSAGHSSVSNVSHVSQASNLSNMSQVSMSGLSNVAPTRPDDPTMSRSLVIAIAAIGGLAALVLLFGVVVGVTAVVHKKPAHPVASASAAAASPAPSASTTSPPPAASVAAAENPPEPEPPEPATSATASAAPSAPDSSEPVAKNDPPKPKPPTTTTTTPSASAPRPAKSVNLAAECENPFTIEPNGIKRPKPQCFGH